MSETIGFWPLAESGLLVRLGETISAPLSRRIAALTASLDAVRLPGVIDLVPSYTTLTILLDPRVADIAAIEDAVRRHWVEAADGAAPAGRTIEIPVVYGGEHGPDLGAVARHTGLTVDEVIRRHSAASYLVGALGFSPGFAYLIGLPPELATPRRPTPRKEVPAGSVGIGGAQTGIYSLPTPGGWHLIGRTFETLFDPRRVHIDEASDNPFPLRMGDEVRFVPVDGPLPQSWERGARRDDLAQPTDSLTTHDRLATASPLPDLGDAFPSPRGVGRVRPGEGASLHVLEPGLQTTVQDAGRPGLGRLGIPPGGAVDRGAYRRANRLVGNDEGAAALEIALTGPRVRFAAFAGERLIAVTGADLGATLNGRRLPVEVAVPVREGDELRFGGRVSGARAYLAVRGGLAVPVVFDSRSTDLTAGFGGLEGRALRTGDRLPLGELPAGSTPASSRRFATASASRPLVARFAAGPQAERFSLPAFCRVEWRVSASSNRVGIRLDGSKIAARGGTDIVSEGMTTGAIQITNDGQPIVMLPARATIGGYARIGTVIGADLDRLAQLAPGDAIRFREVSVAEARALTLAAAHEPDVAEPSDRNGLAVAVELVAQMVAAGGAIEEMEVDAGLAGFRLRVARTGNREP